MYKLKSKHGPTEHASTEELVQAILEIGKKRADPTAVIKAWEK